jgi:pilus assembly protein CpaF
MGLRNAKRARSDAPLDLVPAPAENGAPTPPPRAAGGIEVIRDEVLARIEPAAAIRMTHSELTERIEDLIASIADERRLLVNYAEQRVLAAKIVDDMIDLGPLVPLLKDQTVSDILVNGARQIYVERHGKLELTDAQFRDDLHVLHVAQRIASSIGRRVDEASPMLDARLADASSSAASSISTSS